MEVTETAAITNLVDASHFIDGVRAKGVRVALDDFGAGMSSFGYLNRLSVDLLKSDGTFIHNLVDDPLSEATVRCFADIAKIIGVKTVAEFVDRSAVHERLEHLGIDFAQGFILHTPAPLDEVFEQFRTAS